MQGETYSLRLGVTHGGTFSLRLRVRLFVRLRSEPNDLFLELRVDDEASPAGGHIQPGESLTVRPSASY